MTELGYACTCGFVTDDRRKLSGHFLQMSKKEPGGHASKGQIDLKTGEVILPPWEQRTKEQQKASKKAPLPHTPFVPENEETDDGPELPREPDDPKEKKPISKVGPKTGNPGTIALANATSIKFIPRVFTCNFTPIMQTAYQVAINRWGWPTNMPFEDFLDQCLYLFFYEHDTQLSPFGYLDLAKMQPMDIGEPMVEEETGAELETANT